MKSKPRWMLSAIEAAKDAAATPLFIGSRKRDAVLVPAPQKTARA